MDCVDWLAADRVGKTTRYLRHGYSVQFLVDSQFISPFWRHLSNSGLQSGHAQQVVRRADDERRKLGLRDAREAPAGGNSWTTPA